MIKRNDPCWCGSKKKWKYCHHPIALSSSPLIPKEDYYGKFKIILKNAEQIKGIKKACLVTANILDLLCREAKKGVTTQELDNLSKELHKKFNAIAAPLGYGLPPFPATICTSLNEVICHGIPNNTPLKEGDILNIDVSCIVDGYYGDCSRMVQIPPVEEEKVLLCNVTLEALNKSIQILKPGIAVSAIGDVIENEAKKYNFSVVDQFVGHGIGLEFHEPPHIPHHKNSCNIPLEEGMIFTIEPMINLGVKSGRIDPENQWVARTLDNKASAQWEHTILITKTGYEILTLLE